MNWRNPKLLLLMLALLPQFATAAPVLFSEKAQFVRFEQYTGGSLTLWRMPTPGVSTFPGGSCLSLTIPGTTAMANRFMALYLYAKTENINYFVQYETTNCMVISFGLDG